MQGSFVDVAWAAGLFEGEGSFIAAERRDARGYMYRSTAAQLTSPDLDVLERFADVVGFGTVTGPYGGEQAHWKQYWTWTTSAAPDVIAVIDLLLPYLCSRRRAKAVEVRAAAGEIGTYGRGLCRRGHRIVGDNLMLTENGTRARCRQCHNQRTLALYHKKKEG
jgi:hypothetical protein